jgi:hypothetical protein
MHSPQKIKFIDSINGDEETMSISRLLLGLLAARLFEKWMNNERMILWDIKGDKKRTYYPIIKIGNVG